MKAIEKNKGAIIFYVLIIISTLIIINVQERKLDINNDYVYLQR